MKTKLLVILSTLVLALGMLAQNATPTPSAPTASEKTCACCDHGNTADGKAACVKGEGCCGKEAKCCGGDDAMSSKHGKEAKSCPMMSKDKDGKSICCAEGKCPMMAKGKGCCGDKCMKVEKSSKLSKASCCTKGASCCSSGAACCGASAV